MMAASSKEKQYCPMGRATLCKFRIGRLLQQGDGPRELWGEHIRNIFEIIRGFLGKAPNAIEKFEQLPAEKTIDCKFKYNLIYHNIH